MAQKMQSLRLPLQGQPSTDCFFVVVICSLVFAILSEMISLSSFLLNHTSPVNFCPIAHKSNQILSNNVKSCQTLSYAIKALFFVVVVLYSSYGNIVLIAKFSKFSFKPFQSYGVLSNLVQSCPILSNPWGGACPEGRGAWY